MTLRIRPVQIVVGIAIGAMATVLSMMTLYAQQPTVLDQGKFTYMSHCAGCHGMDGGGHGPFAEGMTPAPTNFQSSTVATLSDNAIQQAVLVGKGTVMRGYSTILTANDINALVLYLRSLATAP